MGVTRHARKSHSLSTDSDSSSRIDWRGSDIMQTSAVLLHCKFGCLRQFSSNNYKVRHENVSRGTCVAIAKPSAAALLASGRRSYRVLAPTPPEQPVPQPAESEDADSDLEAEDAHERRIDRRWFSTLQLMNAGRGLADADIADLLKLLRSEDMPSFKTISQYRVYREEHQHDGGWATHTIQFTHEHLPHVMRPTDPPITFNFR